MRAASGDPRRGKNPMTAINQGTIRFPAPGSSVEQEQTKMKYKQEIYINDCGGLVINGWAAAFYEDRGMPMIFGA